MEDSPYRRKDIDWTNLAFLTLTPLIAIIAQPIYLSIHGVSWGILAVFAFYMITTGLSITAGYHRYFSHLTYKAHPAVRLFYLIFGAAAFQNSALKWASDHRNHHLYVDGDRDPYNIKRGFFYAHIAWVCLRDPRGFSLDNVKDLAKDPLVQFQYRYYVWIGILVGLAAPLGIGYLLGDALGCFLLAGITRIVVVHHSTFLVNSLAHWSGDQPYSVQDSSKDNFFVSFLTYGEGYHNYHHRFPYDYRNGVCWYNWDPSKWFIFVFRFLGLVSDLRSASDEQIFKARLEVQRHLAQEKLIFHPVEIRKVMEEKLHSAYEGLLKARAKWEELKKEYRVVKNSMDQKYREIRLKLESEIKMAKEHFQASSEAWHHLVQGLTQVPAMA